MQYIEKSSLTEDFSGIDVNQISAIRFAACIQQYKWRKLWKISTKKL